MIDKIRKTHDELISEFHGVCEIENVKFNYDKKDDMLTQIKLDGNTIIRIYNKKNGFKIDNSIAINSELANRIILKWKELHYEEQKNSSYTYENIKKVEMIKSELLSLDSSMIKVKPCEVKVNGCQFILEALDNSTNVKVKISYYNSQKLLIQGYTGPLWETICRIIERLEEYDVKGIVKRISKESIGTATSEEAEDYLIYENSLKQILTDKVYNFMSNEDKEYLISAQLLISNNTKFPRYNAVLGPACLSLEGYLKKLLVDLKVAKVHEIGNSKFNFGWIFDENHKLKETRYTSIKESDEEHKKVIKQTLQNIYVLIKSYRNPLSHSGASMNSNILKITQFEKCRQIFENDILDSIKKSYYQVYK